MPQYTYIVFQPLKVSHVLLSRLVLFLGHLRCNDILVHSTLILM